MQDRRVQRALHRTIRQIVDSIEGGKRAAVIYSLIETCKRIGADPFRYLRDVLERLPSTPRERYGELTPRAWLAAQRVAS